MKLPKIKNSILLFLMLFYGLSAFTQNTKNPFKVNLSEDGSKYIKFGMNIQFWGRYTDLNPGSKVGDNVVNETYDLLIRRFRLQAMGVC